MMWRRDLPVPIRMPSGKCYQSRAVYYEEHGEGPFPCFWCRREVSWLPRDQPDALEIDHLDTDVSNDDLSNLAASCPRCNTARAKGLLWLILADHPDANWEAIATWCPHRDTFACGHPVRNNTYLVPSNGERRCLECHRQRARDYARAMP